MFSARLGYFSSNCNFQNFKEDISGLSNTKKAGTILHLKVARERIYNYDFEKSEDIGLQLRRNLSKRMHIKRIVEVAILSGL